MGGLVALIAAVLVGAAIAVGTAVGVVDAATQTPKNTPVVTNPGVIYGQR